MSFLTSAVLASLVAFAPSVTPPREIAADVAEGETAWQEKRWDDASRAFDRAYTASGDATYLYARAQVERSAGRCSVALDLFQAYLDTEPSSAAAEAAQKNIDECRAEDPNAGAVPEPGPVTRPEVVAPEDVGSGSETPAGRASSDVDRPGVRPWHRDPLGGALVGVGGVALVVGGALVGAAYGTVDRATGADDDKAYSRDVDRAAVMERAGAATLGVGAVVLAAGIVRWALVARSSRSTQVVLGPRHFGVRGRF